MNEGLTQDSAEYTPSQAEEEAIADIGLGYDLAAVAAYRNNVGEQYTPILEWEDWIGDFEESYQGEMDTREFAEQLADEMMPADGSEFLMRYFDYEKFERDLFMGDYWESNGYIFRSI